MSSTSPIVTLLGHVCIDHNQLENGPIVKQWGSPLLYMADYLPTKPHLIAPHGVDLYEYIDQTSLSIHAPTHPETLVYKNIVSNDHRIQYSHRLASAEPVVITNEHINVLSKTDIFVAAPITPHLPIEYIKNDILPHLPPNSLKLLLPQGYLRTIDVANGLVGSRNFTEASELIPLFDAVVISDEDGDTPFKDAARWANIAPKTTIIITEGSRGASIISQSGHEHIPTSPIKQTEMQRAPVGCGDVFSIAMLMSLHAKKDIQDSVRDGHAAVRNRLLET